MQNYLAALIIIPVITWYSMFGVLDRNYKLAQQDIENTVYTYTQIAAKKGVIYKSVFDEMCSKLDKYGEYEVYLKAERFEESAEVIKLEGWSIIDADLRNQGYDLINITVVYTKRHPVSVLYEYSVFGTPNGKKYDFRLTARACSYIQ
ncbi:MAG: hypothetical protein ACOZCL_05740 [Bacillota bacterium]